MAIFYYNDMYNADQIKILKNYKIIPGEENNLSESELDIENLYDWNKYVAYNLNKNSGLPPGEYNIPVQIEINENGFISKANPIAEERLLKKSMLQLINTKLVFKNKLYEKNVIISYKINE
jgi:hypothetical protein